MTTRTIRDELLGSLVRQLDLRFSADLAAWLADARQRLDESRLNELQTRRQQLYSQARQALASESPAAEVAFYEFVAADPDISAVMLNGRLGYYDAILPEVAARLVGQPHCRVLDLGSYLGLPALYLAARLPDAQVIGIDRCRDAVCRAEEHRARVRGTNVAFVAGDYQTYAPSEPFDVVLSLQTMPTYLLPWLPADDPESYLRGRQLDRAAVAAVPSLQLVSDALAACARLVKPGGCVILHERFRGYPDAALFQYLAHRAGLRLTEQTAIHWQTANEREGVQQAPLQVAKRESIPVSFDEPAFLASYLPVPATMDLTAPQLDQGVILSGPAAHANFQALATEKIDVCAALSYPQQEVHLHMGLVGQLAAYVYTCSTRDQREFKVCRASHARELFGPVLEFIRQQYQSGAVRCVEPEPGRLTEMVREALGLSK